MVNPTQKLTIYRQTVHKPQPKKGVDCVITEAPLQIQLQYQREKKIELIDWVIVMRTPGDDFDLCYGLLFAEQIIESITDIQSIRFIDNQQTVIRIYLSPMITQMPTARNLISYSSCGLCGTEALTDFKPVLSAIKRNMNEQLHDIDWSALLDAFHQELKLFPETGGNHGCSLFNREGHILITKEDVGRHNALDKIIGYCLHKNPPLSGCGLLLSGRSSYEMLVKAHVLGVSTVVCIGAPSTAAIDHADESGITLIGFMKGVTYNVYTHPSRLTHNQSLQSKVYETQSGNQPID